MNQLYISKIGQVRTKEAWLNWAKTNLFFNKYAKELKIQVPVDLWDRIVRVLKLEIYHQ